MINGFYTQTRPLTNKEQERYIPVMQKLFIRNVSLDQFTTSKAIIAVLLENYGVKVHGSRVRAMVNHLRKTGHEWSPKFVLIATNKGYKLSNDPMEVELYQNSLSQRINEITRVKACVDKQVITINN